MALRHGPAAALLAACTAVAAHGNAGLPSWVRAVEGGAGGLAFVARGELRMVATTTVTALTDLGSVRWCASLEVEGAGLADATVRPDGVTVVVGVLGGGASAREALAVALDPGGAPLWAVRLSGGDGRSLWGVAASEDGTCTAVGTARLADGSEAPWLVRLGPGGELLEERLVGTMPGRGGWVASAADGDLLVVADILYRWGPTVPRSVLVRLGPDWSWRWGLAYPAPQYDDWRAKVLVRPCQDGAGRVLAMLVIRHPLTSGGSYLAVVSGDGSGGTEWVAPVDWGVSAVVPGPSGEPVVLGTIEGHGIAREGWVWMAPGPGSEAPQWLLAGIPGLDPMRAARLRDGSVVLYGRAGGTVEVLARLPQPPGGDACGLLAPASGPAWTPRELGMIPFAESWRPVSSSVAPLELAAAPGDVTTRLLCGAGPAADAAVPAVAPAGAAVLAAALALAGAVALGRARLGQGGPR